jgi:SulP family sulfate permease
MRCDVELTFYDGKEIILVKIADNKFLMDIFTGIIVGINITVSCLAYSGLIFPGILESHLGQAFIVFIMSSLVASAICLIFSKINFNISAPANQVVAILAALSTIVASALSPHMSVNQIILIIFLITSVTTLFTGFTFFFLGYFHLGNVIQYIPYPVSSGFLAGSGWLICKSAMVMLIGKSASFAMFQPFLTKEQMIILATAIFWAGLMLLLVKRYRNPSILPLGLIVSVLFFYIFLAVSHISIQQASALGLLFSKPASQHIYPWVYPISLGKIQENWHFISNHLKEILVVILISCITFLFNITASELIDNKEVNSNKELQLAGVVNIFMGSLGWFVSFFSLTNTIIAKKNGTTSKLSEIIVLLSIILIGIFGMALVPFFPKLVLSALLFYYGFTLLSELIIDNWFKLSRNEYFLSILILLWIVFFGLMYGVFAGIILATALFAYNYSRISIVQFILRGKALQSNTQRPYKIHKFLKGQRDEIVFFKLHEFIFFGTANALLDKIKSYLGTKNKIPAKYIILDYSLVTGVDSSAMTFIYKIKKICLKYKINLLFTNIEPKFRKVFFSWKILERKNRSVRYFSTNDRAIEWCENQIIIANLFASTAEKNLKEQILDLMPTIDVNKFVTYLENVKVRKGNYIFKQKDMSDGLYFIESGQISIIVKLKNGKEQQLRRIGAENIVGEMGLYTNRVRTATALARVDSNLYKLSIISLKRMQTEDPDLANALDRLIINILSERLEYLDKQVKLLF